MNSVIGMSALFIEANFFFSVTITIHFWIFGLKSHPNLLDEETMGNAVFRTYTWFTKGCFAAV